MHAEGQGACRKHFLLAADDEGILYAWHVPHILHVAPVPAASRASSLHPRHFHARARALSARDNVSYTRTVRARFGHKNKEGGGEWGFQGAREGGGEESGWSDDEGSRENDWGCIRGMKVVRGARVVATGHATPAGVCLWSLSSLHLLASVSLSSLSGCTSDLMALAECSFFVGGCCTRATALSLSHATAAPHTQAWHSHEGRANETLCQSQCQGSQFDQGRWGGLRSRSGCRERGREIGRSDCSGGLVSGHDQVIFGGLVSGHDDGKVAVWRIAYRTQGATDATDAHAASEGEGSGRGEFGGIGGIEEGSSRAREEGGWGARDGGSGWGWAASRWVLERETVLQGHTASVEAVETCPQLGVVMSADASGCVRIWSAWEGWRGGQTSGRVMGAEGEARGVGAERWECLVCLPKAHAGSINSMATVLSLGRRRGQAEKGTKEGGGAEPEGWGGVRLYTASDDGMVKSWR
jgi:hypothetical protein